METLLKPLAITPTPRQLQQLEQYAALLREVNAHTNLVAESTMADLETRHILDSAQLVPYLSAKPCKVLDVGSGAGLPGIILAILAPQHTYTLAEKVGKKSAFLQRVVDELKLRNVQVWGKQVSEVREKADIITCRAWAALDTIVITTFPLLRPNGSWWLLKGEAVKSEIEACEKAQQMTIESFPSITHPTGVVLHLTPVSRGTHTSE
ncbi:MAG: 16S rRNA (guanine(527)-N(7))-methyltransferase RsmG [Alphaproteobacteria bacterium]